MNGLSERVAAGAPLLPAHGPRLNETVVRIFPNAESYLRLVQALAVELHQNWLEQHRYLNMEDLREHKKEQLRLAGSPPISSHDRFADLYVHNH
jgi:Transposase, Mutator family